MEETQMEKTEEKKKRVEIERIPLERIRGRIIIINPEESEFAKNLDLKKRGDYFKKK